MHRRLALSAALLALLLVAVTGTALAAGLWSAPEQVDSAGAQTAEAYLLTCPTQSLCFGANGTVPRGIPPTYQGPIVYDLSASGTATGSRADELFFPADGNGPIPAALESLQCPSAGLCVGVAGGNDFEDNLLDVFVSTTPAAGPSSWVEQNLPDPPVQVSCPTTSLCVGAGGDGAIVTSEAPAGGKSAWMRTELDASGTDTFDDIVNVDCASAGFCIAIDDSGDVWTSTDPTGGPGAWSKSAAVAPLAAAAATASSAGEGGSVAYPQNLACSGPNLCVATGTGAGQVLVSTDPAGSAAWTPVTVSSAAVTAVACPPGGTLCLAGDAKGNIATSEDGATWSSVETSIGAGEIGNLSCTGQRCVASALYGSDPPLLADIPTAGAWQWNALSAPTHDPLSAVSCPAANDCITSDQVRYYTSTNPAHGVGSWHAQTEDDQFDDRSAATFDTACYSATGCLAVVVNGMGNDEGQGDGSDDLLRFDPVGGAHAFHDTHLQDSPLYVTCAQGACVTGQPGAWYETSHPGLNGGWHTVTTPRFDVTCLRANTSCIALRAGPFPATAGPDLLVAPRRTGPWTSQTIDPGGEITGLACTSARACVVVDAAGQMLVSTAPTLGPSAWHVSDTDPAGFSDVACESARSCVAVDGNGAVVVGRP